jgi:hypothetical protein
VDLLPSAGADLSLSSAVLVPLVRICKLHPLGSGFPIHEYLVNLK